MKIGGEFARMGGRTQYIFFKKKVAGTLYGLYHSLYQKISKAQAIPDPPHTGHTPPTRATPLPDPSQTA